MAPYIAGLDSKLASAGYTPGTRRNMLKVVGDVGRWLVDEQLAAADFNESRVAVFVAARTQAGFRQKYYWPNFAVMLELLREQGVLAPLPVAAVSPLESVLTDYRQWLFQEKDLATMTVLRYENLARRFLQIGQPAGHLVDTSTLSGTHVSAFILAESGRVSLGSARGRVAEMRSLLRYLFITERTSWNLAGCVPSVAGWRDAHLPVSLSVEQVEAMVASCDCSTSTGRRDRAIMLLLARLGLRSIEVARLRLDDIDWRAGEITVRGKARRRDRMPLPVDAGEALADYLQQGRPASPCREVFITERAPRKPIPANLVGDVVRRAGRRAHCPAGKAHRLRHALATEMLTKGTPLVDIGQVLRHRDLATTAIYAKVDIASLREMAQDWPGQNS
ncbi:MULTISPECIES: site-specific integrase [unclassified Cryobacterium]|uniref:site-specific integrase n=1 Tax=unclassified Cryobacterium TaxID=2649013 RepID=UPI0018E0693E|nr:MULTISPECIES: site-specific integrase [unclassified Cryobacterium]